MVHRHLPYSAASCSSKDAGGQMILYGRILLGCSIVLCVCAGRTHAFPLDTHLYVGSQVLDDALDGTISLCAGTAAKTAVPGGMCNRQYPIAAEMVAALKGNPNAFLAGTLGPDVFPDFAVPQLTVHPGVEGGWGADEWLAHLLKASSTPSSRAFSAGYLSHASSDIFAHSWVNTYAGNAFDLARRLKIGNEVELRHFTLERYLGDKTPRSWTRFGAALAPHEWIADQLILSNTVAIQYKKVGGAAHLVAIESLHELVGRIYRDAKRIHEQAHKIATPILAPLELAKISFQGAEESMRIKAQFLEGTRKALAKRNRIIEDAEAYMLRLAKVIDENPGQITRWGDAIELNKKSLDAWESGAEFLRDSVKRTKQLFDAAKRAYEAAVPDWYPCSLDPVCDEAEEKLDEVESALNRLQAELDREVKRIADVKQENEKLATLISHAHKAIADAKVNQKGVELQLAKDRALRSEEQKAYKEATKSAENAAKAAAEAKERLEDLIKKLKPVTDFLAQYDPILMFLQHWEADIRRAAIAFSAASGEVATHLIAKQTGNALAPYVSWFSCWSPVLTAVPSEIAHGICTAKDIYTQLHSRLEQELSNAVDALGSFGWVIAPGVKMKQEFDKKVRGPLKNEATQSAIHVAKEIGNLWANRQLSDMVGFMSGVDKVTDEKLINVFSTDDSKRGLLHIPDIVERVQRDTGLVGGAQLTEDQFAALYNAIVLSKLALLDAATLNQVLHDLEKDIDPHAKLRQLFSNSNPHFSLLLDAVRSLDGNQQWQATGFPYPRADDRGQERAHDPHFGRPGRQGAHSGFLLWGDTRARELAFKRLFRGPLSPALASHADMRRYTFPECETHQFASTTDAAGSPQPGDGTCGLGGNGAGSNGRYAALSERPVKRSELATLSKGDLRIARNEIFARRGFRFGPELLRAHFGQQPWYRSGEETPAQIGTKISALEWRNIALIRSLERQLRV